MILDSSQLDSKNEEKNEGKNEEKKKVRSKYAENIIRDVLEKISQGQIVDIDEIFKNFIDKDIQFIF